MDSILRDTDGTVAVLTLNKPAILNAWDQPMRDAFAAALRAAFADDAIRAVVVTGAGERAFCAGQDLNEARHFDADRAEAWIEEWRVLYGLIRGAPKPIVAALNGLAAGSAFQLALLCDLRVGHDGVTMGQPEIRSGIASVTGPAIMRMHLGMSRVFDLALTGRMMPASECVALGLINRLVPRDELLAAAVALAAEIGGRPPEALRLTRSWLRALTEAPYEDAMAAATRIHREAYGGSEPSTEMERFLTKTRG